MAVNFKVPASPKKNIFAIDEFLGVDLTNTGSNIDEVRSPNAENMVRFVPGKVRKRTGYHTKIKFNDSKDVNRAKNTSDKYEDCEFITSGALVEGYGAAYFDVYGDITNSVCFYIRIEAVGDYKLRAFGKDGRSYHWEFSGTVEEPCIHLIARYYLDFSVTNGFDYMAMIKLSNNPQDYCKIAELRICDSSYAQNIDEWLELPWTPAPEDNGVIFVKSSLNPAVYGCHILKKGVIEGNRVINVNRVLNTSNEFQVFTASDDSWTQIYTLGNDIYTKDGTQQTNTKIYVEFDYISDKDVRFAVTSWYKTDPVIKNTNGETFHVSFNIPAGSFSNHRCELKSVSGTATVSIKNLSVMYDKNDDYVWTPAPEDNGIRFHIEDIYNIRSKNYATRDSYYATVNTSSRTGYITASIADVNSNVKGFAKVSFDLYTTTAQELDHVEIRLSDQAGFIFTESIVFNENVNSRHIDIYGCATNAERYIESFWVYFYLKTADGACTARVSNIIINEITPKDSYELSPKNYIYHVGNSFYKRASNSISVDKIYSNANAHLSQGWQLNDKIFILDGKRLYLYGIDDADVEVLTDGKGYIPLVTIAKSPSGGGTSYQPLNMLQPGFYEQFMVGSASASATDFYLSFNDLDETTVKVWLLDSNANWIEKTEGTHFTVNRATGVIHFTTAPGISPITGEDNVKILAYKTVPGYAGRISNCTVGTLFGVGGARDRLFLSGNPEFPNWDFYSEQYDPTYFPDTGYSKLGSEASAIVGYAIVNNYLATLKDEFDSSQAIFIREGDLVVKDNVSEPAFKVINTLQGNGIIAPYAVGYLQTEPLFLTKSGIYAVTAQDITGEKYSQNRSFYLDGKLTEEPYLGNAVATVFNDQYVLALNNKLYILDGLQPVRTDKSEPYATRQYVAFYCTGVPANTIWADDQALWIGTSDGKICRFATDIEALESYNDDGEPIYACWETPDLDGKLFYKNKTFRYLAVRLMRSIKTSVKLFSQKLGVWSFIKEDSAVGRVFDFEYIDFENFTFSTDYSEKVVHTKVRVKKVDKAKFRIENGKINEPFGIFDLALEYIESGNYKG